MPDDSQSPGSISEGSYPHSPPDQYPPHGLANVQEGMPSIFAHGSTRSMSEQYGNGPSFIFRPETIGQKPTLFGSFERDPASLTPQSAPANTKVFPTRVNQGHIRTRSVQVEPPTATLFSPISPLSQPAWMACHHAETILRDAGEPPTYNPADAITWARRGFMNLPNHGNQPSSLPSDFTGGNRFPSPMHLAPSNFSAALSVDSPKTVSPGVYQAGYPMPAYRPAYIPPSPRAFSARPEKRTAVLSASYVPRTRAMLPPVGDLRRHSGERSSETRLDEESALPSASLKGFGNHPFESVLPEDNVETTVGPEEVRSFLNPGDTG